MHYMNNVIIYETRHQIKSAETRTRLLNAAEEILLSKGHGQLSIHEVARVAQMTTGAVQHHFGSKAVLMLDLVAYLITRLSDSSDFWPPQSWSKTRRANHFVDKAWQQLYSQPRFTVAWAAYLAVRDDPLLTDHIKAKRAELGQSLMNKMSESFPELAAQPQGTARMQFIFSSLRGLGLLTPFTEENALQPQLRALADTLKFFLKTTETNK